MSRYKNGREMPDGWLSTTEAAVIAKKHQRTIVAWILAGKLPAKKFPGERGPYLINQADLDDLIDKLNTASPYVPRSQDEAAGPQ
jgi:excisionase family DNA binding protein